MNPLNNKKGIGFFTFIGPVVLILVIVLLFMTKPIEDIDEDIDISSAIKAIDIINAKVPAEMFYKKEDTKITIGQSKKSFAETLGLSRDELNLRLESGGEKYTGCRLNSLQLWYNEKNIDKDKKEENSETSSKYSNCLPKFNENFKDKYELFLRNKLEDTTKTILKEQEIDKEPEVDLNYNNDTNEVEVRIGTYYEDSSANNIASMELKLDYTVKYDLGIYPKLLLALNEMIPEMSESIKDKVPSCIKNEEMNELECMEIALYDKINEYDKNILKHYDMSLDFMELESKEYYGLKIMIQNKENKQKELEFGVILRDNIPYSHLNFNLEQFEGIDDTIKLNIEKPRFNDEVASYVIMYSYDDFFNPSSKNYDKILNLLKNNLIPTNFKNTGYSDTGSYQYFYSDFQENEVTLISTSDKTFEEGVDGTDIKSLKLYQIYDKESDKFKLLEEKPLYAYAFATDENLNYYLEDIQGKTKSIVPKSKFGPKPLEVNDKNRVAGESEGYQNSMFFRIGDYSDSRFDHYDLYIVEEGNAISKECKDIKTKCHYYNGKGVLNKQNDTTFVVSSDEIRNDENYDVFIHTNHFSNGLNLKNGKSYDVYIVPVDVNNNAVVSSVKRQWSFNEIVSNDLNFYKLESNINAPIIRPAKFASVEVKDVKPPHPTTSIIVNGINKKDNYLYLQWSSVVPSDVERLEGELRITYKNKADDIIPGKGVSMNGKLIAHTTDMQKVTYAKITPIDSQGNMQNVDEQNSYSASYP